MHSATKFILIVVGGCTLLVQATPSINSSEARVQETVVTEQPVHTFSSCPPECESELSDIAHDHVVIYIEDIEKELQRPIVEKPSLSLIEYIKQKLQDMSLMVAFKYVSLKNVLLKKYGTLKRCMCKLKRNYL